MSSVDVTKKEHTRTDYDGGNWQVTIRYENDEAVDAQLHNKELARRHPYNFYPKLTIDQIRELFQVLGCALHDLGEWNDE